MARPKQLTLAGQEEPSFPEIDAAAEAYLEIRNKRQRLTVKEVDAKNVLLAAMKKEKLAVYRDNTATPPLTVTVLEGKENIKVAEAEYPTPDDAEPEAEVAEG
jgi:hypothetical protein